MRFVVGISGGSGVIYGVRLLEVLKTLGIESHLIMTVPAMETLRLEQPHVQVKYVESLATFSYRTADISASLASGSYKTDGMVVIPCSMKTLGGIAHGYADNLLTRAAEVTLKERRKLILVPRETPLTIIHLRNMLDAASAGAVILPAMPGFYYRPKILDEVVDYIVGKVLDVFGIEHKLFAPWEGPSPVVATKLSELK